MNNLDASLSLLKITANKFQEFEFPKNKKDRYSQIMILFFNRLIIDMSSIQKLIEYGLYGSARTLVAVTIRNLRMFASLINADSERIDKFWDEDEDTYQTNPSFKSEFGENPSKKLAQKLFGNDAFNEIELEKSLHGSGHALRKFYTDRSIIDGLRTPVVKLGAFYNKSYEELLISLADGFVLDFLGVFFTKFKDLDYLQDEFSLYLKLATLAKKTNEAMAQEGSK